MDKGDELFLDIEEEPVEIIEEGLEEQEDDVPEVQEIFLDAQQMEEIDGKILNYILEMMKGDVSDAFWDEMLSVLEKAYMSGYRHSYHKISLTIYQNQNMNEQTLSNILNNINYLQRKMYSENRDKKELNNGVKKLCDHIQLEIVRINNNKENIDEIRSLISEFKKRAEENIKGLEETTEKQKQGFEDKIKDTVDVIKKEINSTVESVVDDVDDVRNNLVGQVVAILGVFAAIVLAFTGGMAFSTSALENINKSSAYRIVIVCLIIGFTFFNAIAALVLYLDRLVFRITGRKKETNESNESRKSHFWNTIKRNILWIAVDLIFVLSMVAVGYKWEHSSEKKVQDVSNQYQIEVHQKNTDELHQESVSTNEVNE